MRTVRSSSHVYPSMHWAGGVCPEGVSAWGVSAQGGVCPEGVSAWEGCLPRGDVSGHGGLVVSLQGGFIPACTGADTPPLWTEWQTGVKTLPCRNYVADGNETCVSFNESSAFIMQCLENLHFEIAFSHNQKLKMQSKSKYCWTGANKLAPSQLFPQLNCQLLHNSYA